MMLTKFFLLLLSVHAGSAAYDPSSYADRLCGDDLTNLWLDVIAVVDNSIGMTNEGLNNVAANIATVFSNGTRIGTSSTEPRTTRLGLVTYNSKATTNADLNKFQSIDDVYNNVFTVLATTSDTTTTYLSSGLEAAETLLQTQSIGTSRGHYKRVVLVYASAYMASGENDPLPVAERLRSSGAYIVTVAYDQGDGALLDALKNIASPGFNFTNADPAGNIVGKIQGALLQANCFCPDDWKQYRQSFSDVTSFRYGSCLQTVTLQANWKSAQLSCHNHWNNSYLATEFSKDKHVFTLALVRSSPKVQQPLSYHIGLNYVNNTWVWDQPAGLPRIPLQPSTFSYWLPSWPKNPSASAAVLNTQNAFDTYWQNVAMFTASSNYVCETYSCDTDIYCDATGVKH